MPTSPSPLGIMRVPYWGLMTIFESRSYSQILYHTILILYYHSNHINEKNESKYCFHVLPPLLLKERGNFFPRSTRAASRQQPSQRCACVQAQEENNRSVKPSKFIQGDSLTIQWPTKNNYQDSECDDKYNFHLMISQGGY